MLDSSKNYIVSGIERSGTSVLMRILQFCGISVAFDDSRPADSHNPTGYFELAGGKIISRLQDNSFDISLYHGQVIKVTAYGIHFLPQGDYKIVYMQRDLDEILQSMSKMGAPINPEYDRALFTRLNSATIGLMNQREDIEYIIVNHKDLYFDLGLVLIRLGRFLSVPLDLNKAARAVEHRLYRNRAAVVS